MVWISVGQKVRLYGKDTDWFYEGEVVSVEDGHALVDFADWTTRYSLSVFRENYDLYMHYIYPVGPGEVVADFRTKQTEEVPLVSF